MQQLDILYINIRSLPDTLEDLQDIVQAYYGDVHVIVLTETWLYAIILTWRDLQLHIIVECPEEEGLAFM